MEEQVMRRCVVVLILVAGIAFLNSVAQGSLVSYYGTEPEQSSNYAASSSVSARSVTRAMPPSDEPSLNGLDISQYAPAELIVNSETGLSLTITTTVTNESSIIWTGYILTLDPTGNATFVEGTAGSTKFGTVLYPDPWTIEFWQPEPVLPGQAVTLQFDIDISGPAPHIFTLTQNPIPEPATAMLLGLDALALLLRRKRWARPTLLLGAICGKSNQ